jgi:hypothetical protein
MLLLLDCLKTVEKTTPTLIEKHEWLKNKITEYESSIDYENLIFQIGKKSHKRINYTEEQVDILKKVLSHLQLQTSELITLPDV